MTVWGKSQILLAMPKHPDLKETVAAFMEKHGVKPSTLGQKALNDPHAVIDLLKGKRRMWPETASKLESFMASYSSEAA